MRDFDYLRGRTGSSQTINLYPHVLPFQRHKFRLNRSSINPEIVKNLTRGQTVTVQKWTVTVQVFVDEAF